MEIKPISDSKGQGVVGAIPTVIVLVLMLAVGAIILNEVTTSFDDDLVGTSSPYEESWNNTKDNSVTGMNMMTVVIILVSAGVLITAVFAFAGRR